MVLEKTIEKLDKLIASQEQTTAPQEKKKAEPKKKPQQQQPVKKKAAAEGSPYAFDIRVGKILTVEKHPGADSLFVEKIDVGEEKPRTVCSGLVGKIEQNDIQDKYVLVMCNLKPGNMRGITSEAMILCATDKDTGKVELLKIPENAKVGDRVDYEGYEKEDADERVSPKKLEKLLPLFGTDAEKNVIFDKTHILNISGAAVTSSFASSNVK